MLSSLFVVGGRIRPPPMLRRVVIGAAAAAAVVTTLQVRPIFLARSVDGDASIVIPSATPDEKAMLLAPWSRLPFSDALATPMFLPDRNAFALDLVATGKVKF